MPAIGARWSSAELWFDLGDGAAGSLRLNAVAHEKELLAIIRALKKWCSDLLGVPISVYTDHRTQVFLSTIIYIRNTVADALSRVAEGAYPDESTTEGIIPTAVA